MRTVLLVILLGLASCSSGPPPLSKPPEDAPVWNLNKGLVQGTNDLIHEPDWNW